MSAGKFASTTMRTRTKIAKNQKRELETLCCCKEVVMRSDYIKTHKRAKFGEMANKKLAPICRLIVATFLILTVSNLLASSQQGANFNVLKVGSNQSQQIFHQKMPSQQLASSLIESGNPNEPSPKSRQTGGVLASLPPLGLRVVPISSRGALSFVSSSQQQPAIPSALSTSPKCPTQLPSNAQSAPTTTTTNKKLFANFGASQQQPTSVSEVLAVEGTNLKLNLVIAGVSLRRQQKQPPSRLRLHWQRDGQLIGDLNLARGRFSSVQLASEQDAETIKHLLGSASDSNSSQLADEFVGREDLLKQDAALDADRHHHELAHHLTNFVTFPFVNERLLEQLESGLNTAHKQYSNMAQLLRQLQKLAQGSSLRTLRRDNFLADGQAIDWLRLGAHLKRAGLIQSDQSQATPTRDQCQLEQQTKIEQLLIIQLEMNQLKLQDRGQYQLYVCQQQLQPIAIHHGSIEAGNMQQQQQPSGALSQSSNQWDCLQGQLAASINLQVLEDVPRLESWFEPQLLQPGDRLSIKCEATGFTLPQISWFLDGRLLSEHPPPQQQQQSDNTNQQRSASSFIDLQLIQVHGQSSLHNDVDEQNNQNQVSSTSTTNSLANSLGHSFRIGDYVSQDNHVHSFVNSSSLRVADGGFYKCQANNGLHAVEHEARVDVRGPVNIGRPLAFNVSSLAGNSRLELQCPYSGHPIGPIEWYFEQHHPTGSSRHLSLVAGLDYADLYSQRNRAQLRRKRKGPTETSDGGGSGSRRESDLEYDSEAQGEEFQASAAQADEPQDLPDPERDEWLAQASSMTNPPMPDEYPEPLPDYPIQALDEDNTQIGGGYRNLDSLDDEFKFQQPPAGSYSELAPNDDYDDSAEALATATRLVQDHKRRRRATSDNQLAGDELAGGKWLKLPQSRRQQVHPNGTLVIHDIQPEDEGLYKCHVTPPASPQQQQHGTGFDQTSWSNELQLSVLVPPVISPFGSSESLREGMRNFLTCSVIGGDSPVRLAWLKDGRPIDEHIARSGGQIESHNNQNQNQTRRIKVETSNEFTSTLYFSHVDFRDNGNYTCVATNKAASVNYTARVVVNVPPKWIKSPKDLESVAGQSIVIDCQAEAHPNPRIWWEIGVATTAGQHEPLAGKQVDEFHSGRSQLSSSPIGQQHEVQSTSGLEQAPNHYRTIISNSRIHILENASLVIRDVNKQDQGYYLCQAANNFGLLSALIRLTVNVGASFANKYQMKFVRLNERVELDCDPNGQAPVTVTWFARQQQLQQQPVGTPVGGGPIENQLNQSFGLPNSANAVYATAEQFPLEFNSPTLIVANNQSSLIYNRLHHHRLHHHHQQQHGERAGSGGSGGESSDADEPDGRTSSTINSVAGRRRLYSGTIQTELAPTTTSQIAAASNAAHNHNHHHHHSATTPALNSDPASFGLSGAGEGGGGSKLVEIDSSMSFEVLKLPRPATTSTTGAANELAPGKPATTTTTANNQPDGDSSSAGSGGELVRMHIKQARRSSSGEYICHASNQFGSDEKLIKLLVQEPPDPVRQISALQIDSRQLSIAWPAPFNGNSPITSYIVEWLELGDDVNGGGGGGAGGSSQSQSPNQDQLEAAGLRRWSQLVVQQPVATIGQLRPLTSYEIRVRAHNQFGYSPVNGPSPGGSGGATQPLVVATSEEAPVAPPSDIKALALSSTRVQVTWLPPPLPPVTPSEGGANAAPRSGDVGGITSLQATNKLHSHRRTTNAAHQSSIKGYYMGYKVANSNDSFIFKTITTPGQSMATADGPPTTLTRPNNHHNHPRTEQQPAPADLTGTRSRMVRVAVGDLKRSTSYSIIVQAFNSAGPGPQSDPIQVKTLDNDPPPAPQLRVAQVTSVSLELQWSFRPQAVSDSIRTSSELDFALQQDQVLAPPATPIASNKDAIKQAAAQTNPVIEGYHLYFRQAGGAQTPDGGGSQLASSSSSASPADQWQERRLSQETHTIIPSPTVAGQNQQQLDNLSDLSIVELSQYQTGLKQAQQLQQPNNWSRFHGSNASDLAQRSFRYQLERLACGNFYQIYLVAYNNYGSGLPSQLIRAKTRGLVPIAPRRQQDFIQVNSTLIQLNLASWQDGGCPLTNFEIKYKQLHGRPEAINMLNSRQQLGPSSIGAQSEPEGWLLLSNNISPDQRSVELRDLQPETWYALWVSSESAAGKTQAHYAFMTLDKFGQLASEALEPLPSLSSDQYSNNPNSNLPALFRSHSSNSNPIRSILSSVAVGSSVVSPLVLSACLCLIIFATCSLILIKRYNSLVKDDQSIDLSASRASAGTSKFPQHGNGASPGGNGDQMQVSHYGTNSNQHYGLEPKSTANGNTDEARSISPLDPHYSMRLSPCKTGATVITNSSSSTNGSSGALLLGAGASSVCDSSGHMAYGSVAQQNYAQQQQHHLAPIGPNDLEHQQHFMQQQQQVPMDHLRQFVACSATINNRNSRQFGKPPTQLLTDNNNPLSMLQSSCFRTLPHSNLRPVSTFLPHTALVTNQQQQLNGFQHEDGANQNGNLNDEFNNYQQQQQIYSKLRLLQHFNEAAAAGNCNAMCLQQQQQQADHEAAMALSQLYSQANTANAPNEQLTQNGSGPNNCTNGNVNASQQQQAPSAAGAAEQDDYALPFPPKWV